MPPFRSVMLWGMIEAIIQLLDDALPLLSVQNKQIVWARHDTRRILQHYFTPSYAIRFSEKAIIISLGSLLVQIWQARSDLGEELFVQLQANYSRLYDPPPTHSQPTFHPWGFEQAIILLGFCVTNWLFPYLSMAHFTPFSSKLSWVFTVLVWHASGNTNTQIHV